MDLSMGAKINSYRVLSLLGKGGMGEVYLAEDERLNRKVALKLLSPDLMVHDASRKRFEREAKALAAINHPNIVTIYSIEQAQGRCFLTMELVEGKTLAQIIPRTGMPVAEIQRIARAIAGALTAAHSRGVIHRDLKPHNIMVTGDDTVKVLDFGLAKLHGEPSRHQEEGPAAEPLTREGLILGTPSYMSPEQIQGKPLDARSDLFSFGIILYEMATGLLPFRGESDMEILSAILRDAPAPGREIRPGLPQKLTGIIDRCLAKDPADRYRDAGTLREELGSLVAPARGAEDLSTVSYGPRPRVKSEKRPIRYALVPLVLLAALVAAFALHRWISPHEPDDPYDLAILPLVDPSAEGLQWAPARQLRRELFEGARELRILPEEEARGMVTAGGSMAADLFSRSASRPAFLLRWEVIRLGAVPALSVDLISGANGDLMQTLTYPLQAQRDLGDLLTGRLARDIEAFLFSWKGTAPYPDGYECLRPSPITWSAEAASLYLDALGSRHNGDDWKALPSLDRALAIDPEFAQATLLRNLVLVALQVPYQGTAMLAPGFQRVLRQRNRLEPWQWEFAKRGSGFSPLGHEGAIAPIEERLVEGLGEHQRTLLRLWTLFFQGRKKELLDFSLSKLQEPSQPFILWLLGAGMVLDLHFSTAQVQDALQPLIDAHPDNPMPHLLLGICLLKDESTQARAEAELARTREILGGRWSPRYAWIAGKMEFYASRFDQAKEILYEALPVGMDGSRFDAPSLLSEMSQIASGGGDPRLYAFLAASHLALDELKQARESLDLYRRVFPGSPWAEYESGKIFEEAGDLEAAVGEWRRCIELDPSFSWAYYRRGMANQSLHRAGDALKDLETFVRLMGPSAQTLAPVVNAKEAISRLQEPGASP